MDEEEKEREGKGRGKRNRRKRRMSMKKSSGGEVYDAKVMSLPDCIELP